MFLLSVKMPLIAIGESSDFKRFKLNFSVMIGLI